jgi:hypothetical protein
MDGSTGRGRGEPVQHLIQGFLWQVGSTCCPEGTHTLGLGLSDPCQEE